MIRGSFQSDCSFDDVLIAAGVELAPNGKYLAKKYRTCEDTAAVFKCCELALNTKDKTIARLMAENKELAIANSKESSEVRVLCQENNKLTKACIGRGLEALPEITPATRERLLTVDR